MLKKLKQAFAVIGLKPTPDMDILKSPIPHENQRDYTKRKRVADYIEQNKELLLARALRPHGIDCKDPVTCEDMNCWKWMPDKIIGKPYKVRR